MERPLYSWNRPIKDPMYRTLDTGLTETSGQDVNIYRLVVTDGKYLQKTIVIRHIFISIVVRSLPSCSFV